MELERRPPKSLRERLEDERWVLLNSYSQGSFLDGAISLRIKEIERILSLSK